MLSYMVVAHILRGNCMTELLLAVNGTLMRGLELCKNMIDANATFLREDRTAKAYRLWSINDNNPAMIRDESSGQSIELEIWSVPTAGLVSILQKEPAGLTIGKVELEDGTYVLGVLAENFILQGQKEITSYKGWRNYIKTL